VKGCRPLQNEEINKLFEELNTRDILLCLCGLYFGLRISEILQLKFKDVTGEFINIKSKKNSENITFEIPEDLKRAVTNLKEYYIQKNINVTEDTYLILSRQGGNRPIDRTQANRILARAADRAGLEGNINSHSFRKSFVTAIYEVSDYNIALTKKYSRHKNLANLDYYIGTCENLDLIKKLNWK